MNVTCGPRQCPVILNSTCVFYEGTNLIYTGINTNDTLQTALHKIDAKFQDAAIGYAFENGVIQTSPGQPVGLGGSLVRNTVINSAGYTFEITGSVESGAFITSGGTSSQFVKGDGSLDSTNYQIAGSYITALTGDGVASGPGSAVFTLSNVNFFPGTYGSPTVIPVITVNAKGLVTSVTNASIPIPSNILLFDGDVSGAGVTGSLTTITLDTVNSNVYGSNTALKFAVNGKGLVTSAAPLIANDIYSIIGYTPVTSARTLTINGVTYNLSANRTWSVGTVTSVNMSAPTGFSVSGNPVTGSGTLALGFAPGFSLPTNASQANWNTAYVNRITSLTILGTSGAATLVGNTLNIPQYQGAGNYLTGLVGEVTAIGFPTANVTLNTSAVTGKLLTGLNLAVGGSIAATDSILQAFGKMQNQINATIAGVIYQGVWDAATNTPTLISSVGNKGDYYIVNVPGNTNLDGITDWEVGDWAIFDGTTWGKVDNTDAVSSVNGFTGAVSLVTTDIPEGTNLYFTDLRARQALTLTTSGSSGAATYDNTTGIFNIPQYSLSGLGGVPTSRQLTINGVSYDLTLDRSWTVTLSSLGEVSLAGSTSGQLLTYNGTNWVNQDPVVPVSSKLFNYYNFI
jgi:thiamine pyrophosphokinase